MLKRVLKRVLKIALEKNSETLSAGQNSDTSMLAKIVSLQHSMPSFKPLSNSYGFCLPRTITFNGSWNNFFAI